MSTTNNISLTIPVAIVTVLTVSLAPACGQTAQRHTAGRTTPTIKPTPTQAVGPTPIPTVDSTPTPTPFPEMVVTDPAMNVYVVGATCPDWLVLTSARQIYSTSELSAMIDWVVLQNDAGMHPSRHGNQPNTLAFTTAGVTDTGPAALQGIYRYRPPPVCGVYLQITNTGKETIQIPRAGIQLIAASQPDDSNYPLVDTCSILRLAIPSHGQSTPSPVYCGQTLGGGAPICAFYSVEVRISQSSAGTTFYGAPLAQPDGSPCPQITLAPGSTVGVSMAVASGQAGVYPMLPVLTVLSSKGVSSVLVREAASSIKFAAPSQFTCSEAEGKAITVRWSGPEALNLDALAPQGHLCT